jgi:hypothetical protein
VSFVDKLQDSDCEVDLADTGDPEPIRPRDRARSLQVGCADVTGEDDFPRIGDQREQPGPVH